MKARYGMGYRWQAPGSNRDHPHQRRVGRSLVAQAVHNARVRRVKGGGLYLGTRVEW